MRRILMITAVSFCLIACLFSCKKDNNIAKEQNASVVSLYNCTEKNMKTEPYICFDSLITDSRCPADVVCVWAGYAMIKVSFHESNNIHVFKMGLWAAIGGAVTDTTINGYKLSFTDLQPYPLVNRPPVTPDEIKATIKISR